MGSLENCYYELRKILGNNIEPIETIQNVDEHRRFWRPEKVKTILLAESHVYTGKVEAEQTIEFPKNILASAPKSFARFVYCLGYGESFLLQKPLTIQRNTGTPQFWQVFHSCVNQVAHNEDFAAVQKKRTPDFSQRIQNKLQLLYQLRQKGIWLVDGSVTALYSPGGNKPKPAEMQRVLKTSWKYYVREQIVQAEPERIICIGHGVRQSLDSCLKEACLCSITQSVKQPNARMKAQERLETFKTYFEICKS